MGQIMKVLTIGTFDLVHAGHAILFKRCELLGELIVGVNSDEFVENYKGQKPIMPYEERVGLIEQMGYAVAPNHTEGLELIMAVNPHYLVIGSDWATKDYYKQINVTQDLLDAMNIVMVYTPYTSDISSTKIKELCQK